MSDLIIGIIIIVGALCCYALWLFVGRRKNVGDDGLTDKERAQCAKRYDEGPGKTPTPSEARTAWLKAHQRTPKKDENDDSTG